jgi:hypothetical protein
MAASTSWRNTAQEKDIVTELLLQTVEDTVSDEEIRRFLNRYERVAGTGIRPAVLLAFDGLHAEALRLLQARIHGVFWNDHVIEAIIVQRPAE